jgi:uridine kinase
MTFNSTKSSNLEIERKFLVDLTKIPFPLDNLKKYEITQFYTELEDKNEKRARKQNGKYIATTKNGRGLVREESEHEISREEYLDMEKRKISSSIEKTRYEIPFGEDTIELNIYNGSLKGLAVAEVEFGSEATSRRFNPPEWFGKEVTQDRTYYNSSLATLDRFEILNGRVIPIFKKDEGIEESIRRIEEKLSSEQHVVALVAGGSASGKTSAIANKIKEAFENKRTGVAMISLDDYSKGTAFVNKQNSEGRKLNFDMPEYVDLDALSRDISLLKEGKEIEKPLFNFKTGERSGFEKVQAARVILVEGLFTLTEKLKDIGDVNIFVDIGPHGRLIRRLMRDIGGRTEWDPRDVLYYNLATVEPMYRKYIEPTKANADILISNNYNPYIEASRTNKKEVQVKFKLDTEEKGKIEKKAELLSSGVNQTDFYYKPKRSNAIRGEELVRIRYDSDKIIFTYKGPMLENQSARIRYKFDILIDKETAERVNEIYEETVHIKKSRELCSFDGVTFSIDNVTKIEGGKERHLGEFIELRLPSSSKISEGVGRIKSGLGLNSEAIMVPYAEM